MYAQYIAAQAFNSGGLGIIHSISHAVSAFYDTHHGLNNAVALPRVWAFNMPVAYKRFADIARRDGHRHPRHDRRAGRRGRAGRVDPAAARRGHPRAVHRRHAGHATPRTGWAQGPTKFYENAKVINGDDDDVDRITNHVLGDACTPGNAKECTFETVRPVVDHCMNGDLDDLLA